VLAVTATQRPARSVLAGSRSTAALTKCIPATTSALPPALSSARTVEAVIHGLPRPARPKLHGSVLVPADLAAVPSVASYRGSANSRRAIVATEHAKSSRTQLFNVARRLRRRT